MLPDDLLRVIAEAASRSSPILTGALCVRTGAPTRCDKHAQPQVPASNAHAQCASARERTRRGAHATVDTLQGSHGHILV